MAVRECGRHAGEPTMAATTNRVKATIVGSLPKPRGVAAFPLLWMLQSGSGTMAAIALVISIGVLWASIYGPEAALFCELFDTRVRYTGVSLIYQVGTIIFLAPIPILAALLVAADGNKPWLLAGCVVLGCCVSALAASLMRCTFLAPAMAATAVPTHTPRG